MNISCCGINCSTCPFTETVHEGMTEPCKGCHAVAGKLFWTQYLGLDVCPIYQCCVNENQYHHCGQCEQLPCEIYFNTKDPSLSEDEHQKSINDRVDVLKKIKL